MPKTTTKSKLKVNHDSITLTTPDWRFRIGRNGFTMSGKNPTQQVFNKLHAFIDGHSGNYGEAMKDLSEQWEDVIK